MLLESTYQRYNFFREPDWRWQRVLKLCENTLRPKRCTKIDDVYVKKAYRFQKKYMNITDPSKREEMWRKDPSFYYAYQLYERRHTDPEGAFCVEARILAGQSFKEIADDLSTHESAIQFYEAVFFNVIPYLTNRDWITTRVILPALVKKVTQLAPIEADNMFHDSEIGNAHMDGSLKLFGYFGGAFLLDMMLHKFQSGSPMRSPEDIGMWLDKNWSTNVRCRSSQAAIHFKVNKFQIIELFTVHSKIIELERSDEAGEKQRTTSERHIKAMVDCLPLAVGDDAKHLYETTAIGGYDKEPAELRDDELMEIGSGGKGPLPDENWPKELPKPRAKAAGILTDDRAKLT